MNFLSRQSTFTPGVCNCVEFMICCPIILGSFVFDVINGL
jgi:hypothetical protein